MNQKGLTLIKQFEGFRGHAYRDAVGVWTVGYGHTSMAGPPRVTPNMTVTREEADRILAHDLQRFEDEVDLAVKVPLNSNQFSALVSFCYNIGGDNFRKSSVLKAVNKRKFSDVPRLMALWNKGGGRVLPGLVNRRAAEGALFVQRDGVASIPMDENTDSGVQPDAPKGKSMAKSTTNAAAGIAGAAGSIGIISDVSSGAARTAENARTMWETLGDLAPYILLVILLAAVGWIIFQRYLKAKDEAV